MVSRVKSFSKTNNSPGLTLVSTYKMMMTGKL